ncbi:hypothetical protein EC957_005938 [Mortierella hygrophila]|uniref:F-box domain-containing protein n=1 Tax=Mortierella hygrophila TaxID=979708 RepID=A0A9P6FEP3_9FUNG|nr:hypothetical protein EC957_005938 [Mortierella hygrophila]
MSTHPLDLPEIVERIGHFLQLWAQELSESENRQITVFDPKTFHACMLVSKLWRDTLLPILWADYDAKGMAWVPEEVLFRNTHHFKTFLLPHTETWRIPGCIRLVQATLHFDARCVERAQRLVQSNPGLKSLVYDGDTCECPLDPNNFAQLSQLEDLSLSGWNISEPGSLGRALAPLAGSLRKLRLGEFAGIEYDDRIWGGNVQGQGWATEESYSNGDFGDTPLLPLVEYLRVTGPPYGLNPIGLIRRCPSLVRLDLTLNGDIGGSKNPLTLRLSDSIRKYCPNLNSLALRGALMQERKEALIRGCAATNGLSEIVVVLCSVSQDTIDSIAPHASTLETLGIFNTTDGNVDLDLLFQLAGQCPRLKWFSIAAWSCSETPSWTVLDALKRSSIWRCHSLEILDVDIIEPSSSTNEKEGDNDVVLLSKLFENGPVDGWYYHSEKSDIPGEEDDFEMSAGLVSEMFNVVARFKFEHLRQLRWTGVIFTRSSRRASAEYDGLPFIYFD